MRLSFAILALVSTTFALGCNHSRSSNPSPEVDPSQQVNTVADDLSTVGLDKMEDGFTGQERAFLPCNTELNVKTKDGAVKLSEVKGLKQKYLTSLVAVRDELAVYCARDAQKVDSCLGGP
jgi:hypothetical protein